MNLKELKGMIAEEYSRYLKEQEDVAVDVQPDVDVDAMGPEMGDEMGEDDPEDMERYLNNYMRRTYVGFAPTFLWDNITFLFWLALGEAEAASNKAQRISGIVPLLPKSGEAIVGETVEEILD